MRSFYTIYRCSWTFYDVLHLSTRAPNVHVTLLWAFSSHRDWALSASHSTASASFAWQSRAQKTVALSSTKAKYMALSDCSRQAVWIKSLLSELGINVPSIHIAGDNQGSLFIGSNPVTEKRSKHIDTRYHYIWQCLEEKKISLYFVEGSKNPADMFTVHTTASGYVCHSYLMIFLHPTHYIHENSNLKNLVNKILTKFETLY